MNSHLEEISEGNKHELSEYICRRKDSSFVDSWEWRKIVEKIYGLEHFWYVAKRNGKIEGFLGLAMCKHPVFGRYLVTAPFASQGGFYSESDSAFQGLIRKAEELQDQCRVRYILIRHMSQKRDFPADWQNDHSYGTYHLQLEDDFDSFSESKIRGSLRNKIRNCMKQQLHAKFGRRDVIDECWKVIRRSMKELGSPYHSKRYLEAVEEILNGKAEFIVAMDGNDDIVGGGLVLSHLNKMEILHLNVLKAYRHMHVADFLYWSAIREGYRRSVHVLDMGRSLVESGNEKYKMKWQPVRHVLNYSYRLSSGKKLPNLNQKNPRFALAIHAWQRLPCFITDILGPRLISGIL